MTHPTFLERLQSGKLLIADGATGTNHQLRGLALGDAPEKWLFTAPDKVLGLHQEFVAAGADIILTDTFGGTAGRLAHSGLKADVFETNRRAAELARQAANGAGTLIAGSVGPTGQLLEPHGEMTHAEAVTAFAEQAHALAAGGVDLIVIETQFDLGEATAAIEGVRSATTLPLVCSFSFDMGKRTMMGLKPAQVARELAARGVDMIGVNCGRSLSDNLAVVEEIVETGAGLPLWVKPNAGLPRLGSNDIAIYDVTPEQMGEFAVRAVELGARVVGGCCGTSPEHLRHIALCARAAASA